ncbi:MAG: cell division protein SepF [Clostridia bacterium]|nr:cell division protein SepF [Clostridia bacterium]
MILDKCMGLLGIGTSDYDEEEEFENEFEEEVVEIEKPARAGYFGRRNLEKKEEVSQAKQPKIIPMTNNTNSKMVITQPLCFDDVKEIGEHLKDKKSVIVNLETVNKEDHRRIVDFISGATFVLDGSVQKISSLIYLVTPKTMEIQNDIERAQYRNKLPFTWMK